NPVRKPAFGGFGNPGRVGGSVLREVGLGSRNGLGDAVRHLLAEFGHNLLGVTSGFHTGFYTRSIRHPIAPTRSAAWLSQRLRLVSAFGAETVVPLSPVRRSGSREGERPSGLRQPPIKR